MGHGSPAIWHSWHRWGTRHQWGQTRHKGDHQTPLSQPIHKSVSWSVQTLWSMMCRNHCSDQMFYKGGPLRCSFSANPWRISKHMLCRFGPRTRHRRGCSLPDLSLRCTRPEFGSAQSQGSKMCTSHFGNCTHCRDCWQQCTHLFGWRMFSQRMRCTGSGHRCSQIRSRRDPGLECLRLDIFHERR